MSGRTKRITTFQINYVLVLSRYEQEAVNAEPRRRLAHLTIHWVFPTKSGVPWSLSILNIITFRDTISVYQPLIHQDRIRQAAPLLVNQWQKVATHGAKANHQQTCCQRCVASIPFQAPHYTYNNHNKLLKRGRLNVYTKALSILSWLFLRSRNRDCISNSSCFETIYTSLLPRVSPLGTSRHLWSNCVVEWFNVLFFNFWNIFSG